ncbi:UDP-Glycosyltransferase/glycogen phosphorylase, partial [Ceratobasidium sp. AG-I]
IVSENFLPKVDGVTRCLARLLKHLRDEGHEAIVLGPEANMSSYETHPVIGTAGIPLILYPGLKLNFLRPKFLRTIVEFFKDPDVIHVVDPIWLGPQVLFALRRGWCGPKWSDPKAPIVASFHTNLPTYASLFGLRFMEAFMWSFIQISHSQCRLTACPTLSTATLLMQKDVRNTRIWPRGVDLGMFGPDKRCHFMRETWGTKSFICVILYAGRLSYEKNLMFMIESFRILLESLDETSLRPVFVFAGDGPARSALEESCRSKNIPAIFMGHLSGENLAKCYASSDIFAFPSYTETFGQVVLEALASGLPVVGLDADGTRDLVQHERTGLLL